MARILLLLILAVVGHRADITPLVDYALLCVGVMQLGHAN